MRVGGKVTFLVNEKIYKGKLDLDEDKDWIFTVTAAAVITHSHVLLLYKQ